MNNPASEHAHDHEIGDLPADSRTLPAMISVSCANVATRSRRCRPGQLAHRDPAEAYLPLLQFDHPGQEPGDGRLAAAGAPHQSEHGSVGQGKVDLTQHGGAVDVGEAHAVEFQ